MIRLILDSEASTYEQDIRELIKSFYPGEDFEIHTPEGVHLSETTQEEKNALKKAKEQQTSVKVNKKSNQDKVLCPEGVADESEILMTMDVSGQEMPLTGVRKKDKSIIKGAIYDMLCDLTGHELPWGDLTGIRPVSLVSPLLDAASDDISASAIKKIRKELESEYRLRGEKLDLVMDIALREKHILDRLKERDESGHIITYRDGWSLYIGIPFCPTRCLYCSFTSNPIGPWTDRLTDYLACLKKDIQLTISELCEKRHMPLQTIYIGGGTPTALPEKYLQVLMDIVHECCDFTHVAEFTVEAGRPDSITREKLEILKAAGVSRISVNPQTFSQKTLDLIGRRHTVEAVKDAYKMAREVGFDNINMDIILGLPEEKLPEVTDTLCEIARLKPDSLTVHSLAVKRAARLTREKDHWAEVYRAGEDFPEMLRMMKASCYAAEVLDLKPYYLYRQKNMAGNLENTGYASEGKECLYNILMMEEKHTVVGCGAGCSSKFIFHDENRVERCDTGKDIQNYMSCLDEMLERKRKLFSDEKHRNTNSAR